MQSLKTRRCFHAPIAAAVLMSLLALPSNAGEKRRPGSGDRPIEFAASVWNVPEQSDSMTLTVFDRSAPVKTRLTEGTLLKGVCVHCEIDLQCRAGDLTKQCPVCPCALTNMACLSGKGAGTSTWQSLLRSLPQGTRLRLEYVAAGKPEQGVKRLILDRHGALLPVEGMTGSTPQQLQALGKSVGAVRIERNTEGNRLQLSFQDNWTFEKEALLEKELAKFGAKVDPPQDETAAP